MIQRRSSGVMACRAVLARWWVVVVLLSGCCSERDAMAVLQREWG
jgi:hypothetical protein